MSAIAGGVLVLLSVAPLAVPRVPLPTVNIPVSAQNQKAFERPSRLKIPKIGVDAPIDPMGLTPDGSLEAPDGATNIGWYKFGPYPGNNGVAVMDGHYGTWESGSTSVFDKLNKLLPGDRIHVQDEAGATASFVVREYKIYPRNKKVPEIFTASDGGAHLNLITCQGSWDNAQQTYADRLVIFADLEPPAVLPTLQTTKSQYYGKQAVEL